MHAKAREWFERLHPGVIPRIEGWGNGSFIDEFPPYKVSARAVTFCARYVFSDRKMMIRLSSSFSNIGTASAPTWRRYHYAYHCGPDPLSIKDTYFRLDLDDVSKHHVHLHPNPRQHIPADDLEPSTRDVDPMKFLDMVEEFRRTGELPLRRIRP